jgi:hypothetical protein
VDPHDSPDDVPVDAELDALLRSVRPQPDPAWTRATRERLLPEAPVRAGWRWRSVRPVTVGATLGLAAVITAVALVGSGPLGGNGGDDARAKQECRTVYVTKVEPSGEVRRQADGTVEVQTVQRPVTREVRDCR